MVEYWLEYLGWGGNILMKIRELIKRLEADGWYLVSIEGSHRQYKHPKKPGRVTIPGHLNDDVHPKTLASIFKQAQLKRQLKDEVERYYYET